MKTIHTKTNHFPIYAVAPVGREIRAIVDVRERIKTGGSRSIGRETMEAPRWPNTNTGILNAMIWAGKMNGCK